MSLPWLIIIYGTSGTPAPAVTLGGRWKKGLQALEKRNSETYPKRYPQNLDPGIKHSAYVLSKAGGHARAESLSPKQRSSIASIAAKVRWK